MVTVQIQVKVAVVVAVVTSVNTQKHRHYYDAFVTLLITLDKNTYHGVIDIVGKISKIELEYEKC